MIFVCLSGCTVDTMNTAVTKFSYNAVLYDDAGDWVDYNFLINNMVKGASYKKPEYLDTYNPYVNMYLPNENSPGSRTFIIKDKETFDKTFDSCPLKVNFDTEMIILHIESDWNSDKHILEKMELKNGVLSIEIVDALTYYELSHQPYARCFVLKMKKTEVNEVKIEIIDRR